ncbi:hypothetical protein [Rhodococcus sp. DMU1]|uniref:hypothetical protein n=1 Tax=Rhodococcus sp. DMU1 TaxID=2722825 RepID=UPI001FF0A545|nr:hypothetical protein [Rhodococcus sp. DMU1]
MRGPIGSAGAALTAQSLAAIVRDHLSGRAPARTHCPYVNRGTGTTTRLSRWRPGLSSIRTTTNAVSPARRHAHDKLDGLAGVFDEIEARVDALLEELFTVLDEP